MNAVLFAFALGSVQTVSFLPGEKWYGGMINDGTRQPYGVTMEAVDLRVDNKGGATASLLLSTSGRYVWDTVPMTYAFTNGVLSVILSDCGRVVAPPGSKTLRSAYQAAMRAHFPFDRKVPPRVLFEKPQFNNWIEMCVTGFKQAEIERYAAEIISNRYPCGVFAVDAGTQTYHGSVAFDPDKMPDPKGLFARLHANGWRTMLWTSYAIRCGTDDAVRLAPYLVNDATGGVWNARRDRKSPGTAFWDLTSAAACELLRERLRTFAAEYGIDGYKFDMGDPWRFTEIGGFRFARPRATPADFSRGYLSFGGDFPLHEYRSGFNVCGECRVQRLHDISHNWEHLRKMSYDVQVAGLLGSPYVFADMVGGGQEGDWKKPDFRPDEKLFVRMAAMQALQPMMQFSVSPWRVLSHEGNVLCRSFAELHVAMASQILSLAENAARTGEPIVRTMEYVFPHQGFARQMTQFMLGDDLLVAPVCEPDDSVVVELPAGHWTDDLGKRHVGPRKLHLKDVPLGRLPRYRLEKQ